MAELFVKELEIIKIDEKNDLVVSQIRLVEQNWQEVAENFYHRPGEFYGMKLSEPELTCFLIRLDIFPYDYHTEKKWFTVPLFGNPAERNRIIMHELCHCQSLCLLFYLLPYAPEPVGLKAHQRKSGDWQGRICQS